MTKSRVTELEFKVACLELELAAIIGILSGKDGSVEKFQSKMQQLKVKLDNGK